LSPASGTVSWDQPADLNIDDFTRVFDLASNTLEDVLAGGLQAFPGALPQRPSGIAQRACGFIDVRPTSTTGRLSLAAATGHS
jgi:hypothetical protein